MLVATVAMRGRGVKGLVAPEACALLRGNSLRVCTEHALVEEEGVGAAQILVADDRTHGGRPDQVRTRWLLQYPSSPHQHLYEESHCEELQRQTL